MRDDSRVVAADLSASLESRRGAARRAVKEGDGWPLSGDCRGSTSRCRWGWPLTAK